MITFANSLGPDHSVGPKLFDTLVVFLKEVFENVKCLKSTDDIKSRNN